jgi:hypothetical protein
MAMGLYHHNFESDEEIATDHTSNLCGNVTNISKPVTHYIGASTLFTNGKYLRKHTAQHLSAKGLDQDYLTGPYTNT